MEGKITKIFNAADQIQAEMIHDHLKQNGIETMSKQPGTGEYDSVQEAADQLVKVVDTVEPDAKLVAKYEAKYQQFREIYPALKGVFQKFD